MRFNLEDYVDQCYLKKTYMDIYANTIMLVNGINLWKRSEEPPILPPQYSRQPGRPRTKRIKNAAEKVNSSGSKLARVQTTIKCSNCDNCGHNAKTLSVCKILYILYVIIT